MLNQGEQESREIDCISQVKGPAHARERFRFAGIGEIEEWMLRLCIFLYMHVVLGRLLKVGTRAVCVCVCAICETIKDEYSAIRVCLFPNHCSQEANS